jgi:hypothetical protein
MGTKLESHVEVLLAKAVNASNAVEAMNFAQAACNAANALRALSDAAATNKATA